MNPLLAVLVVIAIIWVAIVLVGNLPLWLLLLIVILALIGFLA